MTQVGGGARVPDHAARRTSRPFVVKPITPNPRGPAPPGATVHPAPNGLGGAKIDEYGRIRFDDSLRAAARERVRGALKAVTRGGIPPATGGAAGDLPAGIHAASWGEFTSRYATNPRRADLARQLRSTLDALGTAGIEQVVVGGSYVGTKPHPGDIDATWIRPAGRTDRIDVDGAMRSVAATARDIHVYQADSIVTNGGRLQGSRAGETFMELFQHDRSGAARGALLLDTRPLPSGAAGVSEPAAGAAKLRLADAGADALRTSGLRRAMEALPMLLRR